MQREGRGTGRGGRVAAGWWVLTGHLHNVFRHLLPATPPKSMSECKG